MPGAAADEVAIAHAAFVDERAAREGNIHGALGDGGDALTADDIGGGDDLNAMADAGDGLVRRKEVPRDGHEVLVVAEILGGAAAGDEQAEILFRLHVGESDVGRHVIAGAFARDVPAGRDFMHDQMVEARLRTGDHDLIACLF